MKAGFYPRLAATGVAKNRRLYVPYLLTCMGMTAMFYIILFLSRSPLLENVTGGATVQSTLNFGSYVVAIFSLIFLFYTNSFLIRKRTTTSSCRMKHEFPQDSFVFVSIFLLYFTLLTLTVSFLFTITLETK